MDGIIMAGGKGTRMLPLTLTTPKPLLKVQERSILEWGLMSLYDTVDHVLIVVNYLQDQIESYLQSQSLFPTYTLVEQLPKPLGTAHALQCCQPHLKSDSFLVINGDDLFCAADLQTLSQTEMGILSLMKDDPSAYGAIIRDEKGNFERIHEKPPQGLYPTPIPVNIGAYKFTQAIFDYEIPKSERGEYEITDYVSYAAKDHPIAVVETPFWLPIGTPQALEDAQEVDIQRWIPIRNNSV